MDEPKKKQKYFLFLIFFGTVHFTTIPYIYDVVTCTKNIAQKRSVSHIRSPNQIPNINV